MTYLIEVKCPDCNLPFVGRHGKGCKDYQRDLCQNEDCKTKSFMLEYHYRACNRGIEKNIVKMAINSSGIRDISRVPGVSKTTVMNVLKSKETLLLQINPNITTMKFDDASCVRFEPACGMAELNEQWSYVRNTANQCWLWLALDHATGTILAFVFGKRKDEAFRQLQVLLEPFGISRFYNDDWGAYERNIDPEKHEAGKRNTQKIELRNLNFRAWIKRLARKSICFSKIERMHDIVIGLLINALEFGVDIYAKPHIWSTTNEFTVLINQNPMIIANRLRVKDIHIEEEILRIRKQPKLE